jgi:hypothetical protein
MKYSVECEVKKHGTYSKLKKYKNFFQITVHYSTGTVQYSTVQYSTVQFSRVQVQYSTVQYRYSTVQYSTVQ